MMASKFYSKTGLFLVVVLFGLAAASTSKSKVEITGTEAGLTGPHRSLQSAPAGAPFYAQYLVPKSTIAGGLKVLDGKNGVGTQVVLNNPNADSASVLTILADGEIQQGSQVNGQTVCLDVKGAGYYNENSVLFWPCNGQDNQKWNFVAQGNNYHSLSPKAAPSFCLDVQYGSTAVGAKIIIYGCNGGANQAWTLVAAG